MDDPFFLVDPDGGLAISLMAFNSCAHGMNNLEKALVQRRTDGAILGSYRTTVAQELAEFILLDSQQGFFMPPGNDPSFPLSAKLYEITHYEINMNGGGTYYKPTIWQANDIIDDLEKRVAEVGRTQIRIPTSQLIRGEILRAFQASIGRKEQGAAVAHMKLAVGMLEAGAKKWQSLPFAEKGMLFKPTFARGARVYLLNCLIRASRDATTPSAKRMFPLETVEQLAHKISKENPESSWPPHAGEATPTAYHMKPAWEAYSALAYF
ncbi:hypothetical protein JCM8547_007421 [Rhodosporidiobolus lusitaniae]